jgi:hypothetical protein
LIFCRHVPLSIFSFFPLIQYLREYTVLHESSFKEEKIDALVNKLNL